MYEPFILRTFVFLPPRSDAPNQNLLSERKIKCPIIIRARHRRARISKRVSLYWCVSRYLRVAGLDSFLPKATPYGLGVGRQESNSPPHSPSPYEAEGEKT